AADSDNRNHSAVAHPGGDTDLTGHVRLEDGTGFAIVLGHGPLWSECNIVLPIRRYAELHRHCVDRLPLTVSHYGHKAEPFILCGIHRSLQRQVVLGGLPKARSPHQDHQGQSKTYQPFARIASLLCHIFLLIFFSTRCNKVPDVLQRSCSTAYAVLTCMARSTRVFSKDKSHLLSAVPSCPLVTTSCRHVRNTTSFHVTKEGLPHTEPRGRVP